MIRNNKPPAPESPSLSPLDPRKLGKAPSLYSDTSPSRRSLSFERLTPRGFRWSNGEVRPAKKPWKLAPDVPGVSPQRAARSLSLSPVKVPKRRSHEALSPSLKQIFAGALPHEQKFASRSILNSEGPTSTRMFRIRKALLIQSADPLGDFSWSLPNPKTYEMLAEMLANAQEWSAFIILMTDFMFLWRKLQCGDQMGLLHMYDLSTVALSDSGLQSERLVSFFDFFSQNFRTLKTNGTIELFRLAAISRNSYVKGALRNLLLQNERFLQEWRQRLSAQVIAGPNAQPEPGDTLVRLHSALRLQDALKKIYGMQRCGLAKSLSESAQHDLFELVANLAHELESSKGRLREVDLEVVESHLDSAQQFNNLAALWTRSDAGQYENLAIYIPGNVWHDEDARFDLQLKLSDQLAKAAQIDSQLVDIYSISLDDAQPEHSMQGKALVKVLSRALGLEVTVLSGSFWPVQNGADSMKGNVTVAVRLAPLSKKLRSKSAAAEETRTETFLSVRAQRMQLVTKTRPGDINPVNPVFDNEVFEVFLHSPAQCLVITAYSFSNGIQSVVGELYIKADDIFDECQGLTGEEKVVRRFGLLNPSTMRPVYYKNQADKSKLRQADIELSFRLQTRTAPHSTQESVEHIAIQAQDITSALCAGCIVTGLAFEDESASWETINLYIVSNAEEMKCERNFLHRYVLPALEIKSQNLKIHFRCVDLSEFATGGSRDDVVKRLRTLESCHVRNYDRKGRRGQSPLVLCLLGEKRGRILDSKDLHHLEASNHSGLFDWVLKGALKGMTVLEMEMTAALMHADNNAVAVCCRNPEFLNHEGFARLPRSVKEKYVQEYGAPSSEGDQTEHMKMRDFRSTVTSKACNVVRYTPTFNGFEPKRREGAVVHPEIYADTDERAEGEGEVRLGQMLGFGLRVFETLSELITRRYSSSRAIAPIDPFAESGRRQTHLIGALCKNSCLAPGGTQEALIGVLGEFADFLHLDTACVALLVGNHGSGKSTLLARFLVDQKAIKIGTSDVFAQEQDKRRLEKAVKKVIAINRLGGAEASENSGPTRRVCTHDWEQMRSKIRGLSEVAFFICAKAVAPSKKRMFEAFHNMDSMHFSRADLDVAGQDAKDELPLPGWLVRSGASKHMLKQTIQQNFPESSSLDRRDFVRLWKSLVSAMIVHRRHSQGSISDEEARFCWKSPRIFFFFKEKLDTTRTLVSHLCYSVSGQSRSQEASWQHLERLLRNLSATNPILLVLDGLDLHERDQIRHIAFALQGRLRALMTIDDMALSMKDTAGVGGQMRFLVSPLSLVERSLIMNWTVQGLTRLPLGWEELINRPAAGSVLYLQAAAAYLKTAKVLRCVPDPVASIGTDTLEILLRNVIPTTTRRFGQKAVSWLLEILTFDSHPLERKEIQIMMSAVSASESVPAPSDEDTQLLIDCFMPFADVQSLSTPAHISVTRAVVREAYQRYFKNPVVSAKRSLGCKWRETSWNEISLSLRRDTIAEIRNQALSDALKVKLTFSQEELVGLKASKVSRGCYIKVENKYFTPADVGTTNTQDLFNESMDQIKKQADQQDARLQSKLASQFADENANTEEQQADWYSDDDNALSPAETDTCAIKSIKYGLAAEEVTLKFGKVTCKVNRASFGTWCGPSVIGPEVSTHPHGLALFQFRKMLRNLDVFPAYVSQNQVEKAFAAAKTYQPLKRQYALSEVAGKRLDSCSHLDFYEFLDCLKYLHLAYRSSNGHDYDAHHEKAALILQKHFRGGQARSAVKRLKRERVRGNSICGMQFNSAVHIRLIIKMQAILRCRRERAKLRYKLEKRQGEMLIAAQEAGQGENGRNATSVKRPMHVLAVKGHLRVDGIMSVVQKGLKAIFHNVIDAYIYLDVEGNETLTLRDFQAGIMRLHIDVEQQGLSKCAAVIAGADKRIDSMEFIRAFAWHDIANCQDAMDEAKIMKSSIIAKANQRLKTLADATAPASAPAPQAQRVLGAKGSKMGF